MNHMNAVIATLLMTASAAFANTPGAAVLPGSAGVPERGDGGLAQYWWIVLIVAAAAAGVWYLSLRRNRITRENSGSIR